MCEQHAEAIPGASPEAVHAPEVAVVPLRQCDTLTYFTCSTGIDAVRGYLSSGYYVDTALSEPHSHRLTGISV